MGPQLLQFLFQVPDGIDGLFLGIPASLHRRELGIQLSEFVVEGVESFRGGAVAFLFECDLFNFELQHAAFHNVDLCRHRVDFDAQLRCGFVDKVDGLVGKEPVCEVPVRQHGRGHQCGILDADTVVNFVAFF